MQTKIRMLFTVTSVFFVVLSGACRADNISGWAGLSDEPDWTGSGFTSVSGLTAGDLTGNGLADILVAGADDSGHSVFFFYQDDEGGFSRTPDRRLSLEQSARYPVIGDFNGDGKSDFALVLRRELRIFFGADDYAGPLRSMNVNQSAGGPLLYGALGKNTRDFLVGPVVRRYDGNRGIRPGYFHGPDINNNLHAAWGDFDNDGALDVVFSVRGGGLRIYYGPFAGRSVRAREVSQLVEFDAPAHGIPLICDLNGDERLDIITGGRQAMDEDSGNLERCLFMFFQNSPQGFDNNAKPDHVLWSDAAVWTIADMNLDGLCDIILCDRASLAVLLQRKKTPWPDNDGSPDFKTSLPGRAISLATADIDGTGRPDILVAGADYLALFYNRTD